MKLKTASIIGAVFMFAPLVVLSGCTAVVAVATCAEYKCNPVEAWAIYQIALAEHVVEKVGDALDGREKTKRPPPAPPPTVIEEMATLSDEALADLGATIRSDSRATTDILLLTTPRDEILKNVRVENPALTEDEAEQVASYFTLRRTTASDAARLSQMFADVAHDARQSFVFPHEPGTYVVRDLRIRYSYQLRADRNKAARRSGTGKPEYTRFRHGISAAALETPEVNFWCVDHPKWPTPRVVMQEPPFLFATRRTAAGAEGDGFLTVLRAIIDDPARKHALTVASEDFNAMLGPRSKFAPCPEIWKLPASF